MPSAKELAKALAYRGEIRNTPQNSFLGGVANFLAPVSEFADRDKLPGSIPLLGGMSFADLSGLKGAESLVRDMSYGKSPVRGATLNTVKVDPRLLDLAAVSGAMIPVGKALGKAALRNVAEQVQNRTGIARYMPDTRMGVVPEGKAMSVPEGKFSRIVDVFGDGKNVKMYNDASGKYLHKVAIGGKEKWQIGDMGMLDGKHADYLDQPIGKKGDWLGGKQSFDNADDALASLRGAKLSEAAAARNAKYGAIPSTWKGDARNISKKLIDEYGDIQFGSSTQSKSKYATLPDGKKVRMSDHNLPGSYEGADYDFRYGSDLNSFMDSIAGMPSKAMSVPAKTQYELAHEVAQRNAALPKEQGGLGLPSGNTAMDRAGAMGFDTPAYHGTTTEIDPSFNLDYSGANALDYGKKNIWATDNPELASQYAEASLSRNQAEAIQKLGDFNWTKKEEIPDKIADAMFKDIAEYGSIEGGGANVLPLLLRGKQSVHESYGGRFKNEMPKALWGRDLENADIAVIKNVIDNPTLQKVDPSTVYAIKNPANIRSRFAAFDPMRRHEADILAGVGVGGMLDPQAIAEALRQQDRK